MSLVKLVGILLAVFSLFYSDLLQAAVKPIYFGKSIPEAKNTKYDSKAPSRQSGGEMFFIDISLQDKVIKENDTINISELKFKAVSKSGKGSVLIKMAYLAIYSEQEMKWYSDLENFIILNEGESTGKGLSKLSDGETLIIKLPENTPINRLGFVAEGYDHDDASLLVEPSFPDIKPEQELWGKFGRKLVKAASERSNTNQYAKRGYLYGCVSYDENRNEYFGSDRSREVAMQEALRQCRQSWPGSERQCWILKCYQYEPVEF